MPHQLSIFAENKPGKIERVNAVLEDEGINIKAITISDAGDYGIIKLLVDRPEDARDALTKNGIAVTLKPIVAVNIEDKPGGLHKITKLLANARINVEDAYGFATFDGKEGVFIFQVDNVQRTENILKDQNLTIVDDEQLYYL